MRVRTPKNAYRPPNTDHIEEPNDTGITERIPLGSRVDKPRLGGFKGAAVGPLGLAQQPSCS